MLNFSLVLTLIKVLTMFIPLSLLSVLLVSTYGDNQGDGGRNSDSGAGRESSDRGGGGSSWAGAISSAGDCYNGGFNGESD